MLFILELYNCNFIFVAREIDDIDTYFSVLLFLEEMFIIHSRIKLHGNRFCIF